MCYMQHVPDKQHPRGVVRQSKKLAKEYHIDQGQPDAAIMQRLEQRRQMIERNHVSLDGHLFWSIAELLKNKQACIKGRLKLAAVTIRRSMLWGMESATLLLQDIKRLNFAWIDMVSKMLAIVRQDGEPWLDWYIRSLRHAKGVLHYTGIKSLAHFKEPDASKG